jgi:topoisomerase-4 subunit B
MGEDAEKRKEWIQENVKFTLEDKAADIIIETETTINIEE